MSTCTERRLCWNIWAVLPLASRPLWLQSAATHRAASVRKLLPAAGQHLLTKTRLGYLSATIDEILGSWSRDTSRLRKFSQVWRLLLLSLSTWNKCVTSFFWSSAKNEASASLLMSQCEKTHPQTQNYKLFVHSEMQSDGFSKIVFFTFLNRNNICNI